MVEKLDFIWNCRNFHDTLAPTKVYIFRFLFQFSHEIEQQFEDSLTFRTWTLILKELYIDIWWKYVYWLQVFSSYHTVGLSSILISCSCTVRLTLMKKKKLQWQNSKLSFYPNPQTKSHLSERVSNNAGIRPKVLLPHSLNRQHLG